MRVTWDPEKAAQNLRTHGVSFEEAAEVFHDPLSRTVDDVEHSFGGEERLRTVGYSTRGRLLVVIHSEEKEIRIVSARTPTPSEWEEHAEEP
jgi:hypothetical protein